MSRSEWIPDNVKHNDAICIQIDNGVDISTILLFSPMLVKSQEHTKLCFLSIKVFWLDGDKELIENINERPGS